MKIAVFSDSHGRIHNCLSALESIGDVDHILHLGDSAADAEDIGIVYPEIPITYVCGNSDFCAGGAYEKMIELSGKRLFLCHGHTLGVKNGFSELARAAQSADIALFGHTHEIYSGEADGVRLFNPGSISLPASTAPSFGIITIENGQIFAEHKFL